MSWIEKLNFEKAVREIQQYERKGKDFCLDPLRFEDLSLKTVRENFIKEAKTKIQNGNTPQPLIEIDVPKSNYVLRPAARPEIVDWIIYHTIVDFIATQIHKKIYDCNYSFNKFKEQFKKGKKKRMIDHWIEFDDKAIELSKNQKFMFMLTTDITSFFENISLEVLKDRLLMLSTNSDYSASVNYLVDTILNPWTKYNKVQNFSLPQGPEASLILADIYLYSVDREMKDKKIQYIRYMDDIRIYAKTKNELKKYIKALVKSLRDLKLNLNAKKTAIYETCNKESLKKVFDHEKNRLDLINEAFKSNKKAQVSLVKSSLFELFEISKDINNPFSERHLKFCISHFIDLMKFKIMDNKSLQDIINYFLDVFEEKHHLSDIICWFFIVSAQYDKSFVKLIKQRLLRFIKNKDKNIYEWQEMWILDTIRQIGNIKRSELKILEKYSNNHENCRAQFYLIKGQYGNADDREEIFNKIKAVSIKNDQLRYMFIAIQGMHKNIRNKINKVPPHYKDYLNGLKKPKYGFTYALQHQVLDIGQDLGIEQSSATDVEIDWTTYY